jgi:HEAT repeat protein
MGEAVVPDLRYALDDASQPAAVRMQIPRILARIGGVQARDALVENLLVSDVAVRDEVVAGLNRLHVRDPETVVDRRVVEMALTAESVAHYRSHQILASLRSTLDDSDPALLGLQEAIVQERERIIGLMAPLLSSVDVTSVAAALRSPVPTVRANALEFADNMLSPALRQLVLPLIDGQESPDAIVERARSVVGTEVHSQEEAVEAMLTSNNHWLKACGVYAAGALRLEELRPLIEPLTIDPDALLRETARTALQRIEEPAPTLEARRTEARAAAASHAALSSSDAFGVG